MNPDLISWVVTVPSEWSKSAKAQMRKAAFKAGITTSLVSSAMVLLREIDAVALSVMTNEPLNAVEGSCFVVIDAGGGTTDITMNIVELLEGKLVLGQGAYTEGIKASGQQLDMVSLCMKIGFCIYNSCSKLSGSNLL